MSQLSGHMDVKHLQAIYNHRPADVTVGLTVRMLETGETWSENGDVDLASASTIKTLILVGLARAVDAGHLSLDDKLGAGKDIRLSGSGVVNWLDAALELTLRDHAWLMTAISDNSTSNVLIDAVGVDEINAAGADLGVGGTRLGRKFMGNNAPPGPSWNRATANGLVEILTAIWSDTAASPELCAWMRTLLGDQQHVSRLGRYLPDGVSYAGKTGTINRIAHDCGVLTGPKGSVMIAALTDGFDDEYEADVFLGRIGTAAAELVR